MVRKWVLTLLLLIATRTAWGQIDAQFTHYWALTPYYNAASVGAEEDLNIVAASRQQWVGMPNAPKTFLVGANMPLHFLGANHGVGVLLSNETIGLYNNLSVGLQYAYKMNLGGGVLSLGAHLGIYEQRFDATDIFIPEGSDGHNSNESGIPTSELQGITFDMGLGAFYQYEGYYAGLSSLHLNEAQVTFDENYESYLARSYYFVAGGNIPLKNPLYELSPSLFIKSTLQMTQAEMTLRMRYNKLFTGGLSYRWRDAVIVLLGAEIKSVRFGYAYEYPTSAVVKASSGSHEVFVVYKMKLDFSSESTKRHKSIRIL